MIYLFAVYLWAYIISPDISFNGKVIGIKDGDTYVILHDNTPITIRLEHIDCPEGGQEFGKKAKQFASQLIYGREVRVEGHQYDRYHRLLAVVYLGDKCVNQEIVKNGYAWHFVRYSRESIYSELEQEARRTNKGLWADPHPTSPWEWRAAKRSKANLIP